MSIQTTPEHNTIFFTWLNNYSCVLLKTPSKTLLFDPVDVKAKDFPTVDAILITHEHYDHLDTPLVASIQKNTDCAVIADPASTAKLQPSIPAGKLHEIRPGMKIALGQVTVKAHKSNHNAKAPNTYLITTEDNMEIFHTSDSNPYPEMGAMGQAQKIDIVFCTVGVSSSATAETGAEIAWLTKPGLAVPYHAGTVENQKRFEEIVKKKLKRTACLIPKQKEIYQVTKREDK
jgi:L-ascorbate metabolism protein UlaG (beta-lactamase superfamily)